EVAASHRALGPREILRAVLDASSGRVLSYLLCMQAAVNVAAPFFTPYMLGPLRLSYAEFMTLTAAAFLARVLVLPMLGRLAQERGTRAILWWGASGIVPLPVLWLVSHEFAYLLAIQIFAGAAWAALEFATLLTFFEGIKDNERASVLSAFNLGSAVAIAFGALLGSYLFVSLDGTSGGYAWIFGISTAGRLGMLFVLHGTIPARRLVKLRLRSLAVRPTEGTIDRPILAAFPSDASESRSSSVPR
ncbi:MAG: MFS transporter, partial [Myxococcales bacterium]|nr:MFS transporter [Myxococcales bacterium]